MEPWLPLGQSSIIVSLGMMQGLSCFWQDLYMLSQIQLFAPLTV